MARAVRFTKAERTALTLAISEARFTLAFDTTSAGRRLLKSLASIEAKLEAAEAAPAGVNGGDFERELVAAARGKVIEVEGDGAYARIGRQATQMKATLDQARLVGEWMARQGWLNQPQTTIDVLNKWYQWLPKARATQPPPALSPGLGGTSAPADGGPAPAGKAHPRGRQAPGFR